MAAADTVDPNRMDIDPPAPSTTDSSGPETPNSFTTAPSAQPTGVSPAMDGAKPPPWSVPKADDVTPTPERDKGKTKETEMPGAMPSEQPTKDDPKSSANDSKPVPEEEPEVDISHIPPPDLQAVLSKSRDPGSHIDATRLAVPELRVSICFVIVLFQCASVIAR